MHQASIAALATTAEGAGMQAAVAIHQGRRTVRDYLLSPVVKAGQEVGKEK